MADKKTVEKIIKYLFFTAQLILFACVTIYYLNSGYGFGIRNFFWFVVFSMPLCIIFGIISIVVDKKLKKKNGASAAAKQPQTQD